MTEFKGFAPETYNFLTEIGIVNTREFYYANRERYHEFVKTPMTALAEALLPDMLALDPNFNPRLTSIVSRIYRDLRYTRDQRPYRDHAWLGFRQDGNGVGEGMTVYFEITPETVSWGMGMYSGNTALMERFRQRILAKPDTFTALAAKLTDGYAIDGQAYKRDRFPDAPAELKPFLNLKNLGWHHSDRDLVRTFDAAFAEEVRRELDRLAPMYRFLTSFSQE